MTRVVVVNAFERGALRSPERQPEIDGVGSHRRYPGEQHHPRSQRIPRKPNNPAQPHIPRTRPARLEHHHQEVRR